MVQGLQSYKLACLKYGKIIWYIPAIIGVKRLKSCSLNWKILLREGTKSCYIRDGHCIKLLTFQYPCNCWIKRIEAWICKSKGSGHAEFKYTDQNVQRTEFWLNEGHALLPDGVFVCSPWRTWLLFTALLVINAKIWRAGFSYPLFRNVWLKCQKNVKLMSAIRAKSQFASAATSI